MAKKVLDEMPKEETKSKTKKVAPEKEEAEKALEAVEREEKLAKTEDCEKKCGAKKFILPAVIVAIVAIVGCLCFLGYRMIFGDDPVKITTKAIRGLKDSIKDAKDDSNGMYELLSGDDAFEMTSKMNISLPEGMGKYSLDMLLQSDSKNEAAKLGLKAKQNKKEILNLDAVLDSSKIYFKLADTMKNYYFIDATEIIEEFTKEMKDVQTSINPEVLALLSTYDFTKLIDYAADAVDDAFTKDDFEKSKEEITVKGKDVKATKYTAKIDQKKAIKIAKGFAKKAKDDKDLVKLIAKLFGVKESEVKELFDELIDTEPENVVDGYVLYSVYVSTLGKTLGYGFEIEDLGKVIITEKGDVTTISITYGEYYGSIEINEKSDDHVIITGNIMGMITAELDIKDNLKTIKKNKEYKETLDVDFSLSAFGQSVKASLSSETKVKKINKVDTKDVKDAINVDKMTYSQSAQFERELEKSSFYSLIKNISTMMNSGMSMGGFVEDDNTNYATDSKSSAEKTAFVDVAKNYAKAAETAYASDSLNNKQKECYTLAELKNYVSGNSSYTGKVRFLIDSKGEIMSTIVSLSDNKKYMILDYSKDYLNEYSVYDYSSSLWGNTYSTCK